MKIEQSEEQRKLNLGSWGEVRTKRFTLGGQQSMYGPKVMGLDEMTPRAEGGKEHPERTLCTQNLETEKQASERWRSSSQQDIKKDDGVRCPGPPRKKVVQERENGHLHPKLQGEDVK